MLPTFYQEFIHVSRYARWREDLGRREIWEETIARYFMFFNEHLKENHGYTMTKEDANLAVNMTMLEVMPSMRCLMSAGRALSRDNVAGYNPVTGGTKVLTREHGMINIRDLAGSSATVLNKDGRWAEADFKYYGDQATKRVTFKLNSNTIKTVDCTENHRWLLQDDSVVSTADLNVGDRVSFVSAPKPKIDADYKLGVIHGLVYGDGTATKSCGRVKGYHIRICSDHDDILPIFEDYPKCYPESANGDPVVMLYDGFAKTHDLKALPLEQETESYLLGFIRGWLAADGSVSKSSQISLCVGVEGKNWFSRVAPRVGFVPQNERKLPSETNYGERKTESWNVYISRSSCVPGDFIIKRKRDNFRPLESHFVVSTIEENPGIEPVYCAEVPDTNTFILDMGLVTGNCAYLPVDSPRAFDETMYILMCGTGVGFSVERQFVNKLPTVPEELYESQTVITVRDSKIGWATAFKELIALLYSGQIPKWDVSRLRAAGAPLKTMGGRASGPAPLVELFEYVVKMFMNARGRRLTSIECHDIMCKIGEGVVVGGVRRSAMLSLSNLSDQRMRDAKSGAWWETEKQRELANNSVCYTETPDVGQYMAEWLALYQSKSGERGIFNREAAAIQATRSGRRRAFWDEDQENPIPFGTNPCSEIILRPNEFCNLTEAVARPEDSEQDLERKVRAAAVLGTWQSTLTDFRYLTKRWKDNCDEERLLGVSITGIMDSPLLYDGSPDFLEHLRDCVNDENKKWSEILGINQATAGTCVKPSGTVSQLVMAPSGIHAWHASKYIRRVSQDNKDPVTKFMIDAGLPHEAHASKPEHMTVFAFPVRAPEKGLTRDALSAVQHLEIWKKFQDHWCEHKPSITVTVKEEEWPEVGAWVWKNFDAMSGVSFLPHSDHTYRQAPYEEVSDEKLLELEEKMPKEVDWSRLREYESNDQTRHAKELACSAGSCDIL